MYGAMFGKYPNDADFHLAHGVYCYILGRRNQAIISVEFGLTCDPAKVHKWIASEPLMAEDPFWIFYIHKSCIGICPIQHIYRPL